MVVQLTQADIESLKQRGFSEKEISQAVDELEQEDLDQSYGNTKGTPHSSGNVSQFSTKPSDDIARWQLELNDILEQTEHTLRGDIVTFKDGKKEWSDNPNPKNNTLNENGVRICMKFLCMYVNRNTILSDFTDADLKYKVLDFGKRFNDLVFLKYDEMGMDNEDKRKEYASLVNTMKDIVHSAYARAKDGMERESYRKMISVSQASNGGMMGGGLTVNSGQQMRTRGLLNPMRYVAGKYV